MRGVFSKTTIDQIKSRILSPQLSQLVFDVYITPKEFAEMVEKYDQREFEIEIKEIMI